MSTLSKISLLGLCLVGGCSNTTPEIVKDISRMQIPVVQPDNGNKPTNFLEIKKHYSENSAEISQLQTHLKNNYINNADVRDMFDNHSMTHQVYVALTNLEQSGLLNTQYYNEGNDKGLTELHNTLTPLVRDMN